MRRIAKTHLLPKTDKGRAAVFANGHIMIIAGRGGGRASAEGGGIHTSGADVH